MDFTKNIHKHVYSLLLICLMSLSNFVHKLSSFDMVGPIYKLYDIYNIGTCVQRLIFLLNCIYAFKVGCITCQIYYY